MKKIEESKIANIYRVSFILLNTFICSIFFFKISFAETVEVKADYLKSLFDYTNPYRGQTFMLPIEIKANRLTVYVSSNIFQSFTFNLLLTEVDTTDGFHPTKVLFESTPFTIPVGGGNILIPCTADLGGIPLSAEKPYAFILDIFVSLSQINSDTLWEYATRTGMNSGASYAMGDHIYFKVNCTNPLTGLPCGSREDHFAGSWIEETSEDMGFILEYTPVQSVPPVPISFMSSINLLLLNGN
ncbi:MAG: hypothetical protein ACYDBT_06000 [Desulfobulbaceae bacterium]